MSLDEARKRVNARREILEVLASLEHDDAMRVLTEVIVEIEHLGAPPKDFVMYPEGSKKREKVLFLLKAHGSLGPMNLARMVYGTATVPAKRRMYQLLRVLSQEGKISKRDDGCWKLA